MLYNLRIGKSHWTGKTIAECCDIIAAHYNKINAANVIPAENVLLDVESMSGDCVKMAYFNHFGKVFISINRGKQKC